MSRFPITDVTAALEALGMQVSDNAIYAKISSGYVVTAERENESVTITVADAETGGTPTENTNSYLAVSQPIQDGRVLLPSEFTSDDFRDIVAFVIAMKNVSLYFAFGEVVPEGDAFVFEDVSIHDPFSEMQYGESICINFKQGDDVLVLANPVPTYGTEYVAWRDARYERLINPVAEPGQAIH